MTEARASAASARSEAMTAAVVERPPLVGVKSSGVEVGETVAVGVGDGVAVGVGVGVGCTVGAGVGVAGGGGLGVFAGGGVYGA
jgi:hypothetical protein